MWRSQFNKRAVYWLAADMAKKAGQVDASLKKIAKQNSRKLYRKSTE